MECKFITHGLALAYQETVKPCCMWNFDINYKKTHQIQKIDFYNWHKHPDILEAKNLLSNNIWPANCKHCKEVETQGRHDSMRLNGLNAYNNFQNDEITLEIRPGSICNFACQTCWPAASSRVYQYHKQAKLLDININNKKILTSIDIDKSIGIQDFNFLNLIKTRIKTIILLGGEPFYDKHCLKLIDWWDKNTNAELIIFTNGSCVDPDLITSYKNPLILVFSLDAVGLAAEYIRFGTEWNVVWNNFKSIRTLKNVRTRVNITTSAYNYFYVDELINLLLEDWPEVVSFGTAHEKHLTECVVPDSVRPELIEKLSRCLSNIQSSNIEEGQKFNALNAIQSIVTNLHTVPFSSVERENLKLFVEKMDSVKHAKIADYCHLTTKILTK